MVNNILNTQLVEEIFKFSRFMKGQMCFDTALLRLSMLQLQALVFLKRHDKAQMSEIATNFKIELPSATSLVHKLSTLHLVERQADEKDRRLVRIVLTKKGKALLDQAMKERSKKISNTLSYLSEADRKDLLRIMQKLVATMEKIYEKK